MSRRRPRRSACAAGTGPGFTFTGVVPGRGGGAIGGITAFGGGSGVDGLITGEELGGNAGPEGTNAWAHAEVTVKNSVSRRRENFIATSKIYIHQKNDREEVFLQ